MSADRLVYDPVETFARVFADVHLTTHLAGLLTCREVNVLAGLLHHCGHHHAAQGWLAIHRRDCAFPQHH
jgi:hypothetical protein